MDVKNRYIKIRQSGIFQWVSLFAGWVFLISHLLSTPTKFEFKWVFFYVAALELVTISYMLLVVAYSKLKKIKFDKIFDTNNYGIKYKVILPYRLPLPLKLFFLVPAEDGLFLVPVLYAGANVYTAAACGLLFGIWHYPTYQIKYCIPKGLFYFFVALFILPYSGLAPVIVGHFLIDLITGVYLRSSLGRQK